MDHVNLSETQNYNKHNSVICEELSHTNGSVVTLMHGVSSDGDVHSEAADSAIYNFNTVSNLYIFFYFVASYNFYYIHHKWHLMVCADVPLSNYSVTPILPYSLEYSCRLMLHKAWAVVCLQTKTMPLN